eukprot:GHVS01029352.1.p1 GENE.GHVS01029352.1~~GHVS01029352.1.p1  ORF type:complete len:351 (+),score=65.51 GHVS01029352.1:35-1054(+)
MPSAGVAEEEALVPAVISWVVESVESSNATFLGGFVSSFFAIVCSELGDKTFIIAALLSMKHSHIVVFAGAIGALTLMTILSAVVGYALPALLSREYTHYAATVLFFVFGLKLLVEAWNMEPDKGLEEMREVEAELKKTEEEEDDCSERPVEMEECECINVSPTSSNSPKNYPEVITDSSISHSVFFPMEMTEVVEGLPNTPSGGRHGGQTVVLRSKSEVENTMGKVDTDKKRKGRTGIGGIFGCLLGKFLSKTILLQSFTLTFLAEWGDRSQIATIALAATKQPFGVVVGGVIGHALCSGIAVLGGRMIASSISEKTVTYTGGLLFLIFAIMGVAWGI